MCGTCQLGETAGPQLGEAAHRLVKNSLNVRMNSSSHGLSEQLPGHHTMNRLRPAGPSASGRYYGEVTSDYHGNYYNHQGMARPRYPLSSNGQSDRQNFRIQDRLQHHEQLHNVKTGFSALTIDEGMRPRSSGVPSAKMPVMMLSRMPNSGPTANMQQHQFVQQFVQNMGPPIPPPKWIAQAPDMEGIYARHQEVQLGGAYDKQMKIYQIRTRQPQDMPKYGNKL